jgi:hypothetical protein
MFMAAYVTGWMQSLPILLPYFAGALHANSPVMNCMFFVMFERDGIWVVKINRFAVKFGLVTLARCATIGMRKLG